MLKPVRVTAPTEYPVSVNEVKQHARVEDNGDDAIIDTYISSATSYLDGYSGILRRCLITQTWAISMSCFSDKVVRLPFPDVATIVVEYFDENDTLQTLSASEYTILEDARSARVRFSSDLAFPETFDREDAVTLTFVVGYGDASNVPDVIRHVIMLMVAKSFEDRGDEIASNPNSMEFARSMLAPFRVTSF